MIRQELRSTVDFDYEQPITIRRAADWYKGVVRLGLSLTGAEREYTDKQWGYLISKLAEEQGVPVGWLSASVAELAQSELRLQDVAETEFENATG